MVSNGRFIPHASTVDYLIKETSRPSMAVLDYLLESRLDTRDLRVEKVKRRARVTTDDLWMIHKTRSIAHKAAKNVKHNKTKEQDEYVKDVHMSAVGQSQSNVLHVRGIIEELEAEEQLDKLFSQYGTFVSATGARTINRPCAQQYVGKSQSCMVISGRLISHASYSAPEADGGNRRRRRRGGVRRGGGGEPRQIMGAGHHGHTGGRNQCTYDACGINRPF